MTSAIGAFSLSHASLSWGKDDPPGGLLFLGQTSDGARSVWLSATSSGDFFLEAPGQEVVDEWSRSKRGLQLTLSPVVSTGSGLPHTLFELIDGNAVEIDKQNQKGGITFPSHLERPPSLPPFLKPPTGVTPGLPIGVQPPLGTLPPAGVMPGMPGGVAPPIATLPQTPAPPIGTLPPSGTMPTRPALPGGATPPIGTIPGTPTPPPPPPSGGMPTRPALPDGGVPPIATLPPERITSADASIPIARGRDLPVDTHWNVWGDARYATVSDRRNGMDFDGETSLITLGGDRRISTDLVVGILASHEDSRTTGFDRDMRLDSGGFSAGPYFGYRLTNRWALDGVFEYGQMTNDSRIVSLNGQFDSDRYSAALTLTGQFLPDELLVRPRIALTYAHYENDAHAMSGSLFGVPLDLRVAGDKQDYGATEIAMEVSGEFHAAARLFHIGFLDVGLRYEFERPNDGKVLTSQLRQVDTSPWIGSIRGGIRSVLSGSTLVETTASYLSVGHSKLDEWEFRLYASHGF